MSVGAWGGLSTATTGHAYGLTVSGVPIIDHIPVDLAPIRYEEQGVHGTGSLTFVVEQVAGTVALPDGAVVRFTDNVNARILFGGILLNRRETRGPGSILYTEVECAGWGYFLDNRLVPRYESKRDVGGRIRKYTQDRSIVIDLVNRKGGPLQASGATVDLTNSDMDLLKLSGDTLRSALEKVAAEASPGDGETVSATALGRHFYVDNDAQVHYFAGTEGLAAPYRIADGSYVRDVIDTAGLVEYWSLREEAGSTNYGAKGVTNLTAAGTSGVTDVGVVNEPAYRAVTLDGTQRILKTSAPAALFPGDTFSLECWVYRTDSSGTDILIVSTGSTDNSYDLRLDSTGRIRLTRRPSTLDFITTAGISDNEWHHIVVSHSPGATAVYVDGVSEAGTLTTQTFGTAADQFAIGWTSGGWVGRVQHVAVYSTALSAATALAHYNQGISLTPENLMVEYDSTEDVRGVYVRGGNAKGSDWVVEKGTPWEAGSAYAYLDAPHAKTVAARDRKGKAWLRRHERVDSGSFQITGYHGWRVGQLIAVTDATLGLSGATYEIVSVNGEFDGGPGTYEIEFGALSRMLTRRIRRRKLEDIVLP